MSEARTGKAVVVAWASFPCPSCGLQIDTATESPMSEGRKSAQIRGVRCVCGLSYTVEIVEQS